MPSSPTGLAKASRSCRANWARARKSRSCATRSPALSTRVEESERETSAALEGQRRLVREVHHRVKNNLQVIASLLNIHGRNAETPDARAAYAG